ncbi:MAG: hypothetical protein Q7W38_13340 [Deltaproteobacteria bacterium]|nr:hypothetical protein [Deltaproteobacteria bacterium]
MSLSYRIRALWATEALNHNLAAPSLEAAIEPQPEHVLLRSRIY